MKLLTKTSAASVMAIALLSIAACSGDPEAPEGDAVTETRMDEVDVLDGMISDDMANVDAEETTDEFLEENTGNKSTDKQTADKDGADESSADASDEEAVSQSENASASEE